jgi:two-component system, NtrC family, nitrogen regulation sensor histidine kinase NtrY
MGSSFPGEEQKRQLDHQPDHSIIYEYRTVLFSLLAVAPGMLVAGVLIWISAWSAPLRLILLLSLVVITAFLLRLLQKHIVRPLQTLSNVIAALREEDYSFRARGAAPKDPLGELALEINMLADALARQSTRSIEATALMRRVIEVVDAPMFAFDPLGCVRLVNSAGEKLLNKPAAAVLGRSSEQLGLETIIAAENETQIALPQRPDRRWFIRRSQFRQNGVPHVLIVLSDVSRALRDEERSAWQRLIRVLGHELNNSLAPIKSIAGTLATRVTSLTTDDEQQQDFRRGLGIIEARAASLNRFLQSYRRLAQMPSPVLIPTHIRRLVERVAVLETRVPVGVGDSPELNILLDPDQIEQMLINLVKNASEAALERALDTTSGNNPQVIIQWFTKNSQLVLEIKDNGTGLFNPDNAFVPFYTTKPEGTGVGLVLARQIAEAHEGSIRLVNRPDAQGCVATVLLPIRMADDPAGSSESGHSLTKMNNT